MRAIGKMNADNKEMIDWFRIGLNWLIHLLWNCLIVIQEFCRMALKGIDNGFTKWYLIYKKISKKFRIRSQSNDRALYQNSRSFMMLRMLYKHFFPFDW
jgi:hypothetical protein